MKKTFLILTIFAITLVVSANETSLNYDSYGPVKFGTKIQDVEVLLKEKSIKNNNDEAGCYYIKFNSLPNASFMVEEGIVKRAEININSPTILNIPVSFKLKDIKNKYPQVTINRHQYAPDGYYIVFNNSKNTKAILYEYYENKIQMIRAGLKPAVEYVEGCL